MTEAISFSNAREWRTVVQIVTIARFRRPHDPRTCNVHRYHVWRWQTLANDPNYQPFDGMPCACKGLTWTHRHSPERS